MIAQKSLREANVLVGKFSQIRRLGAIVLAGFEQVWGVERAVQRHLALASAVEGADLTADGGTVPPRTPGFAILQCIVGRLVQICNSWRGCLLSLSKAGGAGEIACPNL